MLFSDGFIEAIATKREPKIGEGDWKAFIVDAKLQKNIKTQYGQADAIEMTYSVDCNVCETEKKERIWVSNTSSSKCVALVKQLYGDETPEKIDLSMQVGRKCILTIKHNADNNGNVFDNIVDRKFI